MCEWIFNCLAFRVGLVGLFLAAILPAAQGTTLHFKEPAVFFENFQVISEGKPGFTVEGNNLLRMGNEVETPEHLFAVFTGSQTSAGEGLLTGGRMSVSVVFNRLRVPKQGNDKRDFGLALMVTPGEDRCYYARLLFDLSTLEIGILNPKTGRGWKSLATVQLEGVKDGDRLAFVWNTSAEGGKGRLKASITNPAGSTIAEVQTERDLAEDGFGVAGEGRVGVGLFGWPASTVAFSRFEVLE